MKSIKLTVYFSLILFITLPSYASNVFIVAPHFTDLIEKDGTGAYQKLMKEAAKRSGVTFNEKFTPEKRAIMLFTSKKCDCIYSYANIMREKFGRNNIVASFPLGVIKEYMFTKKGDPILTSTEQLKGKMIGAKLGNEIWHTELLEAGVKIEMVSKDSQNIRKLEKGNIQVFLGFLPDVTQYLDKLAYSPEHPLVIEYDQITCHANSDTRKFIQQLSQALKNMKNDGTTARILGPLYLDFDGNDIAE